MFWVRGLDLDLYRATCATCPPGTSSCPVLPASCRRLHLPGLPLPGEAAAPRAQEFRADSPTGNSASDAKPARALASGAARAKVQAEHGIWGGGALSTWGAGTAKCCFFVTHTRVNGCDQWLQMSAPTANTLGLRGRVGLWHLSDDWNSGIFPGLSCEHTHLGFPLCVL